MNLWRVDEGLRPVAWFVHEHEADRYADALRGCGRVGVRVRPTTAAELASTLSEGERARVEHEEWMAEGRARRRAG